MIHAASRLALASLRERLNNALPALAASNGEQETALASDLYSAAGLLSSQPRLRRTLADASTDASSRGDLIRSLLQGKLAASAVELIGAAVELRWSSGWDLTDSLEIMADDALLAAADQQGALDAVEDELFRFERILNDSGELTAALDDASVPAERRSALVRSVLEGKVNPITLELVTHAVTSGRKRNLQLAIDDLLEASAARRDRSVARVITATELSEEQSSRLAAALTALYGRPINVRTAIDRGVKGGLMVRVGDEVIDGTVATRMTAARNALAR